MFNQSWNWTRDLKKGNSKNCIEDIRYPVVVNVLRHVVVEKLKTNDRGTKEWGTSCIQGIFRSMEKGPLALIKSRASTGVFLFIYFVWYLERLDMPRNKFYFSPEFSR